MGGWLHLCGCIKRVDAMKRVLLLYVADTAGQEKFHALGPIYYSKFRF